MGPANVWILGGYQSDFARNLTREGRDFADLTAEVVDRTLEAAQVDASDIGVVHVANAFGELFARQAHLGAMPATVNEGLWNTPASRREAACADAQTGGWTVPDLTVGDDDVNPVIEGRLRRFDCSQMTDGGAGLVLAGDEYLRDHPDLRPIGRIEGWGHRTVGLGMQQKLDRAANFGGSTATTVSFVVAAAEV
jgi:acetyl-CoA C-acetyltransferase